jgi:hypothetical protein
MNILTIVVPYYIFYFMMGIYFMLSASSDRYDEKCRRSSTHCELHTVSPFATISPLYYLNQRLHFDFWFSFDQIDSSIVIRSNLFWTFSFTTMLLPAVTFWKPSRILYSLILLFFEIFASPIHVVLFLICRAIMWAQ